MKPKQQIITKQQIEEMRRRVARVQEVLDEQLALRDRERALLREKAAKWQMPKYL